ncbi:MAG: hypothetical protein M0P71_11280 [Melioribacteraceae bacterium]|nr:hypothetical protein [Melioribacteraceae bacterium]
MSEQSLEQFSKEQLIANLRKIGKSLIEEKAKTKALEEELTRLKLKPDNLKSPIVDKFSHIIYSRKEEDESLINIKLLIHQAFQGAKSLISDRQVKFEIKSTKSKCETSGIKEYLTDCFILLIENVTKITNKNSIVELQIDEDLRDIIITIDFESSYQFLPDFSKMLEKEFEEFSAESFGIEKEMSFFVINRIIGKHNGQMQFETIGSRNSIRITFPKPNKKKPLQDEAAEFIKKPLQGLIGNPIQKKY